MVIPVERTTRHIIARLAFAGARAIAREGTFEATPPQTSGRTDTASARAREHVLNGNGTSFARPVTA
jgi:hypothetical protein